MIMKKRSKKKATISSMDKVVLVVFLMLLVMTNFVNCNKNMSSGHILGGYSIHYYYHSSLSFALGGCKLQN